MKANSNTILSEIADFFFIDTTPFQLKYWTHPKDNHYDWRGVAPREKYIANLLKVRIMKNSSMTMTDSANMSYSKINVFLFHELYSSRIWIRRWRNQLESGRLPLAIIPWGVSVTMVTPRSFCNCFFQSLRLLRSSHNISLQNTNNLLIIILHHSRIMASISTSMGMTTAWNT